MRNKTNMNKSLPSVICKKIGRYIGMPIISVEKRNTDYGTDDQDSEPEYDGSFRRKSSDNKKSKAIIEA